MSLPHSLCSASRQQLCRVLTSPAARSRHFCTAATECERFHKRDLAAGSIARSGPDTSPNRTPRVPSPAQHTDPEPQPQRLPQGQACDGRSGDWRSSTGSRSSDACSGASRLVCGRGDISDDALPRVIHCQAHCLRNARELQAIPRLALDAALPDERVHQPGSRQGVPPGP